MERLAIAHKPGKVVFPDGEVIRFDVRTPHGVAPSSAVLVVHGFKGFKDWGFFPHVCERLASVGHLVVSFNFSLNGVGASLDEFDDLDAFGRNTVSREVDEAIWMLGKLRAGEWSKGKPPRSVGLLGHSRGGGVATIVAAEAGDAVTSLASWAGISTFRRWTDSQLDDWRTKGVTHILNARTGQEMPLFRTLWDDIRTNAARLNVLSAATRVRARWLVVHGSEDPVVPLSEARALAAAAPSAALKIVKGSGHTFEATHPAKRAPPPGLEAALDATLRHFRDTLPG